MAGIERINIPVASIQPVSIKEIDRSWNSASGKERGVPVDENDSVNQSKVETDTINTTNYKTTESNPDDIEFPE
jgi:hypothetical protein